MILRLDRLLVLDPEDLDRLFPDSGPDLCKSVSICSIWNQLMHTTTLKATGSIVSFSVTLNNYKPIHSRVPGRETSGQ